MLDDVDEDDGFPEFRGVGLEELGGALAFVDDEAGGAAFFGEGGADFEGFDVGEAGVPEEAEEFTVAGADLEDGVVGGEAAEGGEDVGLEVEAFPGGVVFGMEEDFVVQPFAMHSLMGLGFFHIG